MGRVAKKQEKRQGPDDIDDDDSETDGEQFVCNMTGECWEDRPFPAIIDLGFACVMPTDWRPHVEAIRTPQFRARGSFGRPMDTRFRTRPSNW